MFQFEICYTLGERACNYLAVKNNTVATATTVRHSGITVVTRPVSNAPYRVNVPHTQHADVDAGVDAEVDCLTRDNYDLNYRVCIACVSCGRQVYNTVKPALVNATEAAVHWSQEMIADVSSWTTMPEVRTDAHAAC